MLAVKLQSSNMAWLVRNRIARILGHVIWAMGQLVPSNESLVLNTNTHFQVSVTYGCHNIPLLNLIQMLKFGVHLFNLECTIMSEWWEYVIDQSGRYALKYHCFWVSFDCTPLCMAALAHPVTPLWLYICYAGAFHWMQASGCNLCRNMAPFCPR